MSRWSEGRVLGAAPDPASVAAARRLARPSFWSDTGATDVLVWGRCQGSGRTPYQVSVDVSAPAYRCSCPSRKFPCKHAVALLLLWSRGMGSFARADGVDHDEPAGFAAEWAAQRADRPVRATPTASVADPVAQERRRAERLALMDDGIADFSRWLTDLVRTGIAGARGRPYAYWDAAASRLVDAQVPGLAEQVRSMGEDVHAHEDWADRLLRAAGRWWLLCRAWQGRDRLSVETAADLRATLGWALPTAQVRAADELAGPWLVLGAHRTDDGRLQQQRTWLRGIDGELLMVLDFAARGQVLAVRQLAGAVLDVAVARYPGHPPRRALFLDEPVSAGSAIGLGAGSTIRAGLQAAAAGLAGCPWRDRYPLVLSDVQVIHGIRPMIRDTAGDAIPLTADAPVRALLAHTGGGPVELFGEWEGGRLRPLSIVVDGEVVAV